MSSWGKRLQLTWILHLKFIECIFSAQCWSETPKHVAWSESSLPCQSWEHLSITLINSFGRKSGLLSDSSSQRKMNSTCLRLIHLEAEDVGLVKFSASSFNLKMQKLNPQHCIGCVCKQLQENLPESRWPCEATEFHKELACYPVFRLDTRKGASNGGRNHKSDPWMNKGALRSPGWAKGS